MQYYCAQDGNAQKVQEMNLNMQETIPFLCFIQQQNFRLVKNLLKNVGAKTNDFRIHILEADYNVICVDVHDGNRVLISIIDNPKNCVYENEAYIDIDVLISRLCEIRDRIREENNVCNKND